MQLTSKQTLAAKYLADSETEEILFGGAAGGGKSAFGALWLIDRCTRLPGSRWAMGRSRLKTLKETTLKSFFEMAEKTGLERGVHYEFNAQSNFINFSNGSEIMLKDLFAYPSDPNFDELGSLEITGAFIDECNQVTEKAKNVLKSRIRYRLDDYGVIPKLFMTCNPAKNWTYREFYFPHKRGVLEPHKKFIQALLSDNPHISRHYASNLKKLDKVSMERLLKGNWEYDDDPAKLIDFDALMDLFLNTHIEQEPNQLKFITADVARLGSDLAVITVWYGHTVVEIKTIETSKLNILADLITDLKNSHGIPNSHIIADEDGVGGGIVDFMRVRGFVNNSTAIGAENYANLKSQCYYKLAEAINERRIYIKHDRYRDKIVEELEQVKSYKVDNDTKLRVLPKDKIRELIGRSPDFADTLMMRMWFDLNPPKSVYRRTF